VLPLRRAEPILARAAFDAVTDFAIEKFVKKRVKIGCYLAFMDVVRRKMPIDTWLTVN
jgi:hypothetical protein